VVEDGAIVCTPKGKNLVTEDTFSHYILDFEFKLPPGGNNGLGIHYPGEGNGAYTGMELQILDNTAEKYQGQLKDYQWHGSLYTLQPAKKTGLKPVGEWNREVVEVMGDQVRVTLNGELILDANLNTLAKEHPKHEGVKRRCGHLAFLGHGDAVAFRNIRIAELPEADKAPMAQHGFRSLIVDNSLKGWKHTEDTTNWYAHNGIIKHTGKNGPTTHLWTEQSFKDFTLTFDWRWAGRGVMKDQPLVQPDGSHKGKHNIEELDSGILLRGNVKSQVNLWNWSVGSGEVYGYRTDKNIPAELKPALVPKVKADRPLGEWNHMEITMEGEILNVVLNGQKVIENARLPGVPAEGAIGLQHHGQAIDFANIHIREIK